MMLALERFSSVPNSDFCYHYLNWNLWIYGKKQIYLVFVHKCKQKIQSSQQSNKLACSSGCDKGWFRTSNMIITSICFFEMQWLIFSLSRGERKMPGVAQHRIYLLCAESKSLLQLTIIQAVVKDSTALVGVGFLQLSFLVYSSKSSRLYRYRNIDVYSPQAGLLRMMRAVVKPYAAEHLDV